MADTGGMAIPIATQLVQYANDGVDVYYSDGSRLQLAPCGTTFRYYHPPYAGQHPLHGQREIQQRTEFVTSEFRSKVKDAVEFRNRFAERPFLCRALLADESVVALHADIAEVAWPSKLKMSDVTVFPDGAVRLLSADEYAAVTIAPHRQYFTSEILSRLSQRKIRSQHNTTQRSVGSEALPSPINSAAASHSSTSDSIRHDLSSSSHLHTTIPHNSTPYAQTGGLVGDKRSSKDCGISAFPGMGEGKGNTHGPDSDMKWDYIWLSQHHSLTDYPSCWSHPVALLQEYLSKYPQSTTHTRPNSHTDTMEKGEWTSEKSELNLNKSAIKLNSTCVSTGECTMSATERRAVTLQRLLKKDFAGCTFVPAPKTLPTSCPSLHLHRWRPEVVNATDNDQAEAAYMYGKVKVICAQGIIYKLMWKNPRSVEIYPGDGSLMRSSGMSGQFFTHFMSISNQTEERTYSTSSPPPTIPGTPYSVAKLVTRAARFLKHLCEESLHSLLSDDPCCWAVLPKESNPVEPMKTILLEDCFVENVGHFTAYSNGHIRIVFADRTSLEMVCDFTKRVLTGADPEAIKRYHKRPKPLGLSPGIVRLLLRNGHYHNIEATDPAPYDCYVKAALHWSEWVGSSPAERETFYKDTIYDTDKQKTIENELKKIKCFNFIVDNTLKTPLGDGSASSSVEKNPSTAYWAPGYSQPSSQSYTSHRLLQGQQRCSPSSYQAPASFNMSSIQDVLRKTAEAVADLDRFMQNAANPNPNQI